MNQAQIDGMTLMQSQSIFTPFALEMLEGRVYQLSDHQEVICDTLDRVLTGEIKRLIINIPPAYAKAIDCDTPMFTENGWLLAGDVKSGMRIMGSNGQWTEVLAVHPQGIKPAYNVEFSDGSSLVTCGEHLWSVKLRDKGKNGWSSPYRVKTTDHIKNDLKGKDGRLKWRIPVLNDVGNLDVELPIDPYLLGCWLGDGDSASARITTMDKEVVNAFIDYDPTPTKYQNSGKATTYSLRNKFITKLKSVGVFGNKHIPIIYMQASHRQRLALLQGLMDTDGTVSKDNHGQVYSSSRERLSQDFGSLVTSLGGTYRLYKYQPKIGKLNYSHLISMPYGDCAFRLDRHISKISIRKECNSPRRFVKSITSVTDRPMVCFTVDAKDSLFCAGRDFIVTHNTAIAVWSFVSRGFAFNPASKFLHLSYSDVLVNDNSANIRAIINSAEYQRVYPHVQLRIDSKSKGLWKTSAGGAFRAAPSGGAVTGFRAGVLGSKIFAGCFPYDELIETERGPMKIGAVVEGKIDVKVYSYNFVSKLLELQPITHFFNNPPNNIIEVKMTDGSTFKCTPNHKILTSRGWVEAQYLRYFDRIVSTLDFSSPLDLIKAQASNTDYFCAWQTSIKHNFKLIIGKFWAINPMRVRKPRGNTAPCFAGFNLPDNPRTYPIDFTKIFRGIAAGKYINNHDAIKLGPRPTLKQWKRPVFDSILHVIGLRPPRKIFKPVINWIAVKMPALLTRQPRANKAFKHSNMTPFVGNNTFNAAVKSKIAATIQLQFKYFFRDYVRLPAPTNNNALFAFSSAVIAYFISMIKPNYRSPLLITDCGHADKTFCLGVGGNHNFILHKSKVIVSNCLIIDDPLKADDANSDVIRNGINARWENVFRSRLASPDTPVIVIMQRLAENDFTNHLIRESGETWHHLVLPAYIDRSLPYPFKDCNTIPIEHDLPDGALWDAKYNEAQSLALMSDGQYSQNPKSLGGNLIKGAWFKYYTQLPILQYRMIYADTAMKTKESSDYSVFQCWGKTKDGAGIYLIDQIRGKWEAPDLERMAIAFWNKHKAENVNTHGSLRKMGVESKSSGTGLVQSIRRKGLIPIFEIERNVDKFTRVCDAMPSIESGYVYLPEDAAFTLDFVSECESFTKDDTHAHDDQIDPMCDAITDMLGKGRMHINEAALKNLS